MNHVGDYIIIRQNCVAAKGNKTVSYDVYKTWIKEYGRVLLQTAIQCGFCTPGFIMTTVEIVNSKKLYTDDELRKLLSGHLCRCTGYENILRAVKKTMYQRLGKSIDF